MQTSDELMREKYPHTHIDTANDIESWYGQKVGNNPIIIAYEAYMPETGEEIYLLITRKDWSYHATRDKTVKEAIDFAWEALKQQQRYKKRYRPWHLFPLMWFLITKRPDATREIAMRAGNCTAGTNKWFQDHGFADADVVRWYQMIRHLFYARSRMVVWYLREDWKKSKNLVGTATA